MTQSLIAALVGWQISFLMYGNSEFFNSHARFQQLISAASISSCGGFVQDLMDGYFRAFETFSTIQPAAMALTVYPRIRHTAHVQ